jgi:predicted dehydrogenase
MKTIVIGLGIQGKKRQKFLKENCVGSVDTISSLAKYSSIKKVPLDLYDAAFVCTPDAYKKEILNYLIKNKKHILVEKPLLSKRSEDLLLLKTLSEEQNVTIYTAYNHRFEVHFNRMKALLDSKILGKIYYCKMFYGNGTAKDIKNSPWRDKHFGVIVDLGSHLLDALLYWFGNLPDDFSVVGCHNFENKTCDHINIHSEKIFPIDLEMSYVSWKNHFSCDIYAEKGSVHIESLCKWGASKFILRKRILPSGAPLEEIFTLSQPDTTWKEEQDYFYKLCKESKSNISNDIKINNVLQKLIDQIF